MGADYSRWTFNPAKDYAEVLKQQGRVDLDADWNELVEIFDRRCRAETFDLIGRAIVPMSTPEAFLIIPSGPGRFSIGVGRMYVDGLLVECHGVRGTRYDAVLGEVNGTAPVPFTSQPYYPHPQFLPTGAGSTDLIYLDVWRREASAIQDPAIREIALGGPDTTTRLQTVWQVKVLPRVGERISCGADIREWDALVAPSAGRLTTSTVVPPVSPDPCILSPTGGYRGLENRLYRVEIHVAGAVGGAPPAKFKWSRDNASVVSAVDAISAPGGSSSVVTLKSLGKDRILRFQADDWVEILDDEIEFAGTSGFLTKIVSPPDEANRTIAVTPSVPADLFDPANTQRHTRVRRWDQRSKGGGSNVDPATGLIDVTAGPLDIEDGIQVSFGAEPAGGKLHVGDYWIFAARTADGSVEPLQSAPPRGILHHYVRLGFMTWDKVRLGRFVDCRQFWPPESSSGCCCTATIRPADLVGNTTLQSIIDRFTNVDHVTISLQPGTYTLQAPLVLGAQHPHLTLEGCGRGAVLEVAPGAQARFLDGMIVLNQTAGVTLSGLTFNLPVVPFVAAGGSLAALDAATLASSGGPQVRTLQDLSVSVGVRPVGCSGLTIKSCSFIYPVAQAASSRGDTGANLFAAAVLASGPCQSWSFEDNVFSSQGGSRRSTLEPFQLLLGCAITPTTAITSVTQATAGAGRELLGGTVLPSTLQGLRFRGNAFSGLSAAVLALGETDAVIFDDNTTDRSYSGVWLLARRTPPGLQSISPGDRDTHSRFFNGVLQDPVVQLGSAIARSYPLPVSSGISGSQVPLSNVAPSLSQRPNPAGSLLSQFDVLLQLVSAMETAAAANTRPVGLRPSIHCSDNRIDAGAPDADLGTSGGAMVVWGDEKASSTNLIVRTNHMRNEGRATVPTATIVLVTLCTITGNLIFNEVSTSEPPGDSLFVILDQNQQSAMAVTGNILRGADNLPSNWKPFNAEL